jgi:uncharacterized iron-regulated membrane protein
MRKRLIIRRLHRYLGVVLGIQFLFWTVSGLYFSWGNHDIVTSVPYKKSPLPFSPDSNYASIKIVFDNIREKYPIESVVSAQLIEVNNHPYYQVVFAMPPHHHHVQLADALTGALRDPLSKEEAIELARSHFNGTGEVIDIQYLTHVSNNHEYRKNKLPAYAVTFKHPQNVTVYVASEYGTVEKYRNSRWRIFDWLWMTHTMDYRTRDDLNNWLLRIFSLFGVFTILSGFTLFIVSSRLLNKRFRYL